MTWLKRKKTPYPLNLLLFSLFQGSFILLGHFFSRLCRSPLLFELMINPLSLPSSQLDTTDKWSRSVVSNSLRPHRLQPTRLLGPWDFPGKSTGVGCHFLLQGIFPTQGSNPGLPHCRQTLYCLSHQGSPVLHNENVILWKMSIKILKKWNYKMEISQ